MFRPLHISAVGAGSVGGPGAWATILSVVVGTGAATAVLTVYQGQTTSGPVVGIFDCSSTRSIVLGVDCKDGFNWVLSGGNADITIAYS